MQRIFLPDYFYVFLSKRVETLEKKGRKQQSYSKFFRHASLEHVIKDDMLKLPRRDSIIVTSYKLWLRLKLTEILNWFIHWLIVKKKV